MPAWAPVFLFRVWGSSKPASTSPAAVRNELFRSPNGSKRLTVSARFSIAVRLLRPGSIASSRSTSGGGEGWIKRSQDSRHFQPGAFFRFIAVVRYPLTFGGIRAIFVILVHGRFSPMVLFRQSPNVQVVPTTEIFRTSRRRARGTGKKPARGGWPRSGTTFAPRQAVGLLLYPTFPATVGRLRLLGLLRDARHRPRSLRSAALSRSVA